MIYVNKITLDHKTTYECGWNGYMGCMLTEGAEASALITILA
jgi:hypothetical protein